MKTTKPTPKKRLRLEYIEAADLAENPGNWRTHPKKQLDGLKDVLDDVGWAGALLYNERTKRLVDGHARKKIAKGKVPVLIGSWTEDEERKILATLDPLAAMAEANKDALAALLKSVSSESQAVTELMEDLRRRNGIAPELNGDGSAAEEIDYGEEDEDALDLLFKAPFPWFGGKSRVSRMVWKRFGDVKCFVEPFFGSGAVLLNRPQPFEGVETVNDFDGLVCNFWRALQAKPKEVAKWADWPVNENDANARHMWLVERKETLQAKLEGAPDYFDAKIAGWWCWGMACWIGGGFCEGKGPWQIQQVDGVRKLVHLRDAGQGVNRKRVHLSDAGQGVKRKRVHLGSAGRGVNRKRVHESTDGKAGFGERGLLAWMEALADRLARVRVCCGDWTRVCGGDSGDALQHFFAAGEPCGVFLDPPYADTADRTDEIYRVESLQVAHAVRAWAIAHGWDHRLRIALCGYEGEHKMPASWTCVRWKAQGGMARLGNNKGKDNCFRERVWFSPHCLKASP